jgi:hypothetical protein
MYKFQGVQNTSNNFSGTNTNLINTNEISSVNELIEIPHHQSISSYHSKSSYNTNQIDHNILNMNSHEENTIKNNNYV